MAIKPSISKKLVGRDNGGVPDEEAPPEGIVDEFIPGDKSARKAFLVAHGHGCPKNDSNRGAARLWPQQFKDHAKDTDVEWTFQRSPKPESGWSR